MQKSGRQATATPGDEQLYVQVLVNVFHLLLCFLNRSSLVCHPLTDVLFPPHPGSSASVMQPHLVLLVETDLFPPPPAFFFCSFQEG